MSFFPDAYLNNFFSCYLTLHIVNIALDCTLAEITQYSWQCVASLSHAVLYLSTFIATHCIASLQ